MSAVKCPECNKKVSDQATVCPRCGYNRLVASTQKTKPASAPASAPANRMGRGQLWAIIIFMFAAALLIRLFSG